MNRLARWAIAFAIVTAGGDALAQPWVDGYYPGWAAGTLPTSEIDYTAMSTVIDFSLDVKANGSVDSSANGVGAISAQSVAAAHAAGDKILICVGGAGTGSTFDSAISSNLSVFVANIVAYVKQYGYDGVDVDAEPIGATTFGPFVKALRAALPSPYIVTTTAGDGDQTTIAAVASYLDQINIMTYDMSGNWQGWVSWFNGPLFTYGKAATNGGEANASVDVVVGHFLAAGIPAAKIGIGSEFGGAVWSSVTGPNQTPGGSVAYDVPYTTIKGYGGTYTFDTQAQASSTTSSKGWATYDDVADVAAKLQYIKSKGLGGLILWSLDMDHTKGTHNQDALLEAVKANWGSTSTDGGAPPPTSDAGTVTDAGSVTGDSGDSGTTITTGGSGGCSTSGGGTASPVLFAGLLALLLRRARRVM